MSLKGPPSEEDREVAIRSWLGSLVPSRRSAYDDPKNSIELLLHDGADLCQFVSCSF